MTATKQQLQLFTLENSAGMRAGITNYGARIVSIAVPDRRGNFADVTTGFEKLERYFDKNPYFGAIIGRYANRIAKGKFKLNGKEYALTVNGGPNSLHGGAQGFDRKFWAVRGSEAGRSSLELAYLSADGEENYPGNLSVVVTYTLTEDNAVRIDYVAKTDRDTVINLTNHAYFDLSGAGNILETQMMINADSFTPVDSALIPTGEIRDVTGTAFDFRTPELIGRRIDEDNPQLKLATGYDHNFVLKRSGEGIELAARALDPGSGRVLEVLTTEPGIQFYTGNFLDGTLKGKRGMVYTRRCAFCLEAQHFPDSPNHSSFPTTVLHAGQEYRQTTVFKFSVA